jgi:hypothetical protein
MRYRRRGTGPSCARDDSIVVIAIAAVEHPEIEDR